MQIFVNNNECWLASLNVQSLNSKHLHLHNFLNDRAMAANPPLVIALQETWTIFDTGQIDIPRYKFVHLQRPTRGGGVGFYVREDTQFNIVTALTTMIPRSFECITIELQT